MTPLSSARPTERVGSRGGHVHARRTFSKLIARLALALTVVAAAVLIAGGSSAQPGLAASTIAGALPVPRADGITVGFAGTNDPQLLAGAQPFEVASLAMFHVASQSWRTYVPGAPAFAQTITSLNLRPESIVFARRTSATTLVSTPGLLAGAPMIEIADQPQRFEIPPADGLTLGVSGTTIPEALIASQLFNTATMNVWRVAQQRYLTFIPGAPARVNTLTAANLNVFDFVWLKAIGGATGGIVLEDTPLVARLVPFGAGGTLIGFDAPQFGELIDNGDGSVTYIPNENYHGPDSFTYTVMTPDGPELRSFRIIVEPQNDPPIANDDAAVAEDGSATIIDVLENDEDPDGDPLTIRSTKQPAHGVVAILGSRVIYTPEPEFTGVDAFSYEITDGIVDPGHEDAIATVVVAVGGGALAGPPSGGGGGSGGGGEAGGGEEGGTEDPPFVSDDSVELGTCDGPIVISPLANDAGDGVTTLVISSVSPASLGTAADNGDGTLTYTPPIECEGVDSFGYTVPDAEGVDQGATVTVTMGDAVGGGSGENQPPEAVDDSGATFENDPIIIAVLANDTDPDGDELSISSLTQPAGGSVVDNGDGTVTYTADGFAGQTSFTYTASDGRGGEATATVSITVEAGPVAPVGPVIVQAGGQVTIQVVTPSSFVQLDSVTDGSHGSTSMNAGAGTVTYQPDAGYIGDDRITWTLLFSHGGTAQTTLQLQVVE